VDFYTSSINGNKNEYSTPRLIDMLYTEYLQNLQVYLNYVSTLPDKSKTT